MNEVCTRRKVDPTLVESDNIKWVLLLIHLVDFNDDKAETYLKQFIRSQSKVLKNQKCRMEVKRYVSIINFSLSTSRYIALALSFSLNLPLPLSQSTIIALAKSCSKE